MDGLLGFILAGFALTGSLGPATISLAATGAAFGARRGLGYLVGIVAGVIAVMALVASGLTGLMLALPSATPVMAALAAAYIAWLAWQIATAPRSASRPGRSRHRSSPASSWGWPIPKPMRPWPPCSRASC